MTRWNISLGQKKSFRLTIMILLTAGCDTDERLVKQASEAADRQAEQNKEMARVNKSVAEESITK